MPVSTILLHLNPYQPRWRQFFSVFSEGQLDINEASAELIAVAAGTDIEGVKNVIDQRNGEDGIPRTEDDQEFQSVSEAIAFIQGDGIAEDPALIEGRFTTQSGTVRIESTGFVGSFRRKLVLVIRNRESTPVILSREEIPLD